METCPAEAWAACAREFTNGTPTETQMSTITYVATPLRSTVLVPAIALRYFAAVQPNEVLTHIILPQVAPNCQLSGAFLTLQLPCGRN